MILDFFELLSPANNFNFSLIETDTPTSDARENLVYGLTRPDFCLQIL